MLAFSILPCSNWLIQGRLSPVRSDKSAWVSPLMKAVGIEKSKKGLRLNSPARDLSDYKLRLRKTSAVRSNEAKVSGAA